ncbi:hypothetical protein [Bradyrhizobium sp.]|jgi:hypothetical protein|uniref:hypothetical protein n=1 Tax=Bradyrhizobium sp. TaxID=376 RepID=UPI003BB09EA6
MSMVGFPLLLIPLAIYNIIVFLMPGVSFAEPLVTLPLTSGAQWPVTLSDVLLSLGILMLLLEVIKGARPGAKFLTDHLLSLIVFGAALAEFLLWPRFASSAYFLLTLLALVDFLSGVALRVRRGALVTVAASRSARPIPVEARQEPADLPAVQPAPVNEPIIPAPSEPTFAHPETSAAPASEPAAGPQAGSASPPPETAH